MSIHVHLHENGKWVLSFETEERTIFYRNKKDEIHFFESKEEAARHVETFDVQRLYGERFHESGVFRSGNELKEAAMEKLNEFLDKGF